MSGREIIIGLSLFGLGFYLGPGLRNAPPPVAPLPTSGLEKLQSLAEGDLEDYYRLKTMEDKYKKADEILGKMVVIFLADLGLRVSQRTQIASTAGKVAPPDAVPSPGHRRPTVSSVLEQNSPLGRLSSGEQQLMQVRDQHQVAPHLQRVKIEQFENALKASQSFSNRANVLNSLIGSFEGPSNVRIGQKDEGWLVHLDVAGNMDKGKLSGMVRTRLLKDGKTLSDSNSKGENIEAFREFASDSSAILLKASPHIFLQLYYLRDIDQLAANIYRRQTDAEGFEHIGSAQLKRML